MKVKELMNQLQHANPKDEVVIGNKVDPSHCGMKPFISIEAVYIGFDWDKGKVYLIPKSKIKPKKNMKNKTKKEKQPMHDCPAFGKKISTPKAFNSKTNKICYKCPFCGYQEEIK